MAQYCNKILLLFNHAKLIRHIDRLLLNSTSMVSKILLTIQNIIMFIINIFIFFLYLLRENVYMIESRDILK